MCPVLLQHVRAVFSGDEYQQNKIFYHFFNICFFVVVTDGNASTRATTVASTVTVATTISASSRVTVASTANVASHTSVDITGTQTTTSSTNPPTSSEGTLGLTFSLDQTFTSDLSDQTSASFQTLAAAVIQVVGRCICTMYFSYQTMYCTKFTF